jgi:hypothetical protein
VQGYALKLKKMKSVPEYYIITSGDLVNAVPLARLEDSITKAKKVFSGSDYVQTVTRTIENKRRQAIENSPETIGIYCSQLSEVIDLICKIGLHGADCQAAFECLNVKETAGELLEMVSELYVFLETRNRTVSNTIQKVF